MDEKGSNLSDDKMGKKEEEVEAVQPVFDTQGAAALRAARAKTEKKDETQIELKLSHDNGYDPVPERFFDGSVQDLYNSETQHMEMLNMRICELPDLSPLGGGVKTVNLRQNFLLNLKGLEALVNLERIDLYLNAIEEIPDFSPWTKLTWLDLSFNQIRKLSNFESATHLKELYLVNNKIRKIENVNHLVNLDQIEFGGNRIRKIENLDGMRLEKLWLGKNKIRKLENLSTLSNLKLLSLQSNRIEVIENLDSLPQLEELYLSHNGIKRISGIEKNVNLRVLDIAANFVEKLENLNSLKNLEELWLNDNKIDSWAGLNCITSNKIHTIYLERNPISQTSMYRQRLISAFPTLRQLDASTLQARMQIKNNADEDVD